MERLYKSDSHQSVAANDLKLGGSSENVESKQLKMPSMSSTLSDLLDPKINNQFKINRLPSLPNFEIQGTTNSKNQNPDPTGSSKAPEKSNEIPNIYRPPLDFDDPPKASDKKPEQGKPQEKQDPKQDPGKPPEKQQPTFEPPKRKDLSTGNSTIPTLPPLIVPFDPRPDKPTTPPKKNDNWFPRPEIKPDPTQKEPWPRTLTPIVPRDYSGDRRTPSDAPQTPRDNTAAAYWRGKSISDPELISKGVLEASYIQEVRSRHPDAILIGENGNIRYMNSNGEFTLKQNVPLWLPRAAGLAFLRAQEEATRNGVPIRLEDGPRNYNPAGRTNSQQQSAVRTARVAARVGASRHQSTGAMDLQNWNNPVVQRALRNNGWQHGDGRGPIANDYHHWSYAGG